MAAGHGKTDTGTDSWLSVSNIEICLQCANFQQKFLIQSKQIQEEQTNITLHENILKTLKKQKAKTKPLRLNKLRWIFFLFNAEGSFRR